MEAVIRDRTEMSLSEIIYHHAMTQDIDGMKSAYRNYKEHHPDRWSTTEANINNIGYNLLKESNFELAIAVFSLNSESYPQSANRYDSLAEAYLKSGNRNKAISLHRQALEVDPKFDNSIQMLKNLEGEGKPRRTLAP